MADAHPPGSHALSGKTMWQILKQTFSEFSEDKVPRLGAALSYYTIFSIAPLLVIAVGVVGWMMGSQGKDASDSPVVQQVTSLVGGEGGKAIENMVNASAYKPKSGKVATIVGIITLLFGATGVFGQLQDALNTVWEVTPKPNRGVWGFIRDRFLSFAMVGGVLFLLLVSLVVSAGLAAMGKFMGGGSTGFMHYVWAAVNFVVSYIVITALFAMMFKILPDVKMAWRDTVIGAAATALLFVIGKWAIGMYLGRASVGSTYGAIGSAVVLLLWVYYSSQIFLLGAEFTQVYSKELGSNYKPSENAVQVSEEQRVHEGIPHTAAVEEAAGVRSGSSSADRPGSAAWAGPGKAVTDGGGGGGGGRVMPASVGFAAGWLAARATAPKPKKLMLGPGVKLVTDPRRPEHPTAHARHDVHLWQRFKKGWERGRDEA